MLILSERLIIVVFFVVCLLLGSPLTDVLAGESQPSAVFTPIPHTVRANSFLVGVSDKPGIFDTNASNNTVIFPSSSKEISIFPYQVSADGRFLVVQVPEDAASGAVRLNKGSQLLGVTQLNVEKSEQNLGQVMFLVLVIMLFLLFVVLLVYLFRSLGKKGWKINEAIGELQTIKGDLLKDANGQPLKDAQGNLLYEEKTSSVASSSRLIAVIGLFVIVVSGLCILTVATWVLLTTGKTPDLAGLSTFIAAQAALFTPYFANQIKQGLK